MYALRTNPNNRLRSCRVCENCGKEFESWKSFLEHGKCVSDDADSRLSSSPADSGGNWLKRKRSFRAKLTAPAMQISTEEEDLANCLMMLSNATAGVDPTEPEESCASASRDDLDPRRSNHFSPVSFRFPENHNNNKGKGISTSANTNNKGLFECKACKKVFNSHQALGGHRASHKKVKGCFAARLNDNDNKNDNDNDNVVVHHEDHHLFASPTLSNNNNEAILFPSENRVGSTTKRKSKVHECSICHRIFSSGQALGGHKRCHWITSNSGAAAVTEFQEAAGIDHLKLDLNLPAENTAEIYLPPPWNNIRGSSSISGVKEDQLYHQNEVVEDHVVQKKKKSTSEDEGDSTVKLAKLSELKDMNASEAPSSTWLQVGIASTTHVQSVP